jgi:hypothetical protein
MNTLDLHGIRHHDVDRLVENFILLNQNSLPLTIICGNSSKMIELVKVVTSRLECIIHEPNFGIIVVRNL